MCTSGSQPFLWARGFEAANEILVLFGPSGAGKTSILGAVAGLLAPDSGEIRFDGHLFFRGGHEQPSVHVPARSRRIGYVMQDFALFPHLSAIENVAFGLRRRADRWQRAAALLEQVQLSHLAGHPAAGALRRPAAAGRAGAGRSRSSPGCCCWTNPFPRSILQRGSGCRKICARCTPLQASPFSTLLTGWKMRSSLATASPWSATAASSRRAVSPSCARIRPLQG